MVSAVKNLVLVWRLLDTKAGNAIVPTLAKRGFNKPNRKSFAVINLGLIEKFIGEGVDARNHRRRIGRVWFVRRKLDGVRVLAKGEITSKVTISVCGASKAAIEAVEKAGT